MSLSDPPPASRRQPSLIDVPDAASKRARLAPSLRMLDGLDEEDGKPAPRKAAKGAVPGGLPSMPAVSGFDTTRIDEARAARAGRTGWIVAAASALVVLALLWWWTPLRDVPAPAPADVATAGAQAAPAGIASSMPVAAELDPARIETVREAEVPIAPPLAIARSPHDNAAASAVASTAIVAAASTGASSHATEGRRVTDQRGSMGTTAGPVAVAGRASTPSAASTVVAASLVNAALPAVTPRGPAPPSPASAVNVTAGSRSATSADPDVALFNALLARMADGGKTDPNALPRPALGDLIERCEARAGKGTPEAASCRARVCADQWGKSEACPAALAPKKH